jgi:molecular chaperone GrpE
MNHDDVKPSGGKDWQKVANASDEATTTETVADSATAETASEAEQAGADSRVELDVAAVEQLQKELEQANDLIDKLKADVLYAQSELQNSLRRADEKVAKAHKFGTEKLLEALIPVTDTMEQALLTDSADATTMREGMSMTFELLIKTLGKFGVTVIDPQGQTFDPHLHEAMSMQETKDAQPNTVITVFQKGFLLNERVIRPARVVVAKAPA